MQHHKDKILAKMLQITIIIMMCGFSTSSVFGQMTPNIYSDIWTDDSLNVYGIGVTDEGANQFGHEPGANATLRSPNGRISQFDTGLGGGIADVYLPFDPSDLGIYAICTSHYDYCPVAMQIYNYGSTLAQLFRFDAEYTYQREFIYVGGDKAKYNRCNNPAGYCTPFDFKRTDFQPNSLPTYATSVMHVVVGTLAGTVCVPGQKTIADTCVPDPNPTPPL